ncbi:hypothetical protein EKO04_007874 [Ascochyta lentis]|uniref:SnoaL-like domain-containing protein n=1 Tax=Ascochyta lentis TaxID=205686 RepID=A0A8H7J049_9PLEO|nr:hypothetical protein EKO04_007874 [Ascochyta lentis]
MSETTQDRRTTTSHSQTQKHTALHETALSFVATQHYNASLDGKLDFPSLRALVTPSYTHTFGPAYAVSVAPKLQGVFSVDELIAHLSGMVGHLDGWEVEVNGCVVDEVGESVVVRASYEMRVKGAEEVVVNEVVWWLELEEQVGGGWKIKRSREMVDAVAAGRIRELMAESRGSG